MFYKANNLPSLEYHFHAGVKWLRYVLRHFVPFLDAPRPVPSQLLLQRISQKHIDQKHIENILIRNISETY
jgi:hypothetical protein